MGTWALIRRRPRPPETSLSLRHRPNMCSTSAWDLEEIPLEDDDLNTIEFKILAYYTRHHVFKSTPALSSTKLLRTRAVDSKVISIANRVAEIVYSWPPPEVTQARGFKSKDTFVLDGLIVESQSFSSSKKAEEEQIIAKIVELLKYSGDELEIKLKKDKVLMGHFQDGLSYSVFKTITDRVLMGVDTRGESEVKAHGFKAALAIDVMAKLTAIDNHPMNRVLGFGTKYLKENFSPWIQQHGGWATEAWQGDKGRQTDSSSHLERLTGLLTGLSLMQRLRVHDIFVIAALTQPF
nr:apoptosis facilitator Bcl-2-like protein 14 isoform X5 [Aotus nancymaae]